jgi:hypothetical protein
LGVVSAGVGSGTLSELVSVWSLMAASADISENLRKRLML